MQKILKTLFATSILTAVPIFASEALPDAGAEGEAVHHTSEVVPTEVVEQVTINRGSVDEARELERLGHKDGAVEIFKAILIDPEASLNDKIYAALKLHDSRYKGYVIDFYWSLLRNPETTTDLQFRIAMYLEAWGYKDELRAFLWKLYG
ncbi:MAG: hypothetical protein Q8Q56_05200, partial [Alphaproteobacteria bacterium]|nr:hypothetical protein [Alphaproteobacteria bacterium]